MQHTIRETQVTDLLVKKRNQQLVPAILYYLGLCLTVHNECHRQRRKVSWSMFHRHC